MLRCFRRRRWRRVEDGFGSLSRGVRPLKGRLVLRHHRKTTIGFRPSRGGRTLAGGSKALLAHLHRPVCNNSNRHLYNCDNHSNLHLREHLHRGGGKVLRFLIRLSS